MIAYVREVQFKMNDEPVAILVEIYRSEESFPAQRRLDAFYANTKQSVLQTLVPAAEAGRPWSDQETLVPAQAMVDTHADWGGLGIVVQLAPPPAPPAPPEEAQ